MMSFSARLLELAASNGALVLHCALKSSVVLLVMSTLVLLGRGFSAALRHTLWLLTCLAVLLLPVMTVLLPAWQPAFTQPMLAPTTPTSPVVEAEVKDTHWEETPHQFLYSLAAGHTKSEAFTTSFDKEQIVLAICLGIWLLGAACMALRYLLGAMAMHRLLHRSEKVKEGEIAAEYQVALCSLGFSEPNFSTPRLFIGDEAGLSVPVTWGALRPIVMLPRTALQWSVACRRAALLHELSHIKRGDWLAQSLASLVSVIYWFHPLVWFVARQLRVESERATDDRVLATGLAAPDYSSFLIEIVRFMNARHRGFMLNTVPLVGTSRLEARLRSILDPRRNRGNVTRKLVVALALLTASAVIPLASVRASDKTTAQAEAPNTPKVQSPTKFAHVPTAEEKKKIDAWLSLPSKERDARFREREEHGVMSAKESALLSKVGAYLEHNYAVPDEDVDSVLHLIERGPLVDTDRNRNRLRMYSISSLIPGRKLTEAQQGRAMKVIGQLTNDPPKDKIHEVYYAISDHALTEAQQQRARMVAKLLANDPLRGKVHRFTGLTPGRTLTAAEQQRATVVAKLLANDSLWGKVHRPNGIQSPAVSIQLTAITFVDSIGSPEATAFLQNLRKTVQVKEAQKRIDNYLARDNTR